MTYAAGSPPLVSGTVRLQTRQTWPLIALAAVWSWAVWACAEHWRGDPNYSYGWSVPLLVAGFAFRRGLIYTDFRTNDRWRLTPSTRPQSIVWILLAVAVGLLEYCREEVVHPIFVIWGIALLAIAVTLTALCHLIGKGFARFELFPICFFLTALPWPPRLEQPITGGLMRFVALTTTEVLHWVGIGATASGGAIALQGGLVGITEACSGVRSLQAGVMFGLAMGEWFLLTAARRTLLLLLAIILALVSNLGRTIALTLQANEHGVESVDRVHDLIGNIAVTALVAAIWIAGKVLARPAAREVKSPELGQKSKRIAAVLGLASWRSYAGVFFSVVIGLVSARVIVARMEARDQTQTSPFFAARTAGSPQNHLGTIPHSIWNELHPTSGQYIHHDNASSSSQVADCYHFFWKPSPWNRFALVHRPDICMPGVGWQLDGPATSKEVELAGRPLRFYVFRFHRGDVQALELWGAWRNGESVPIDYRPDQVLGASAAPAALHLAGRRRSATEIVSCSIVAEGQPPSISSALDVLRAVFTYTKP
jgi:exosortase